MKDQLEELRQSLVDGIHMIDCVLEEQPQDEPENDSSIHYRGKVGIVVGHGRQGDKGAVSIGGVSEWDYNCKIAEVMHLKIEDSILIHATGKSGYSDHQEEVARTLDNAGCTAAIELHFNSAGDPGANGHEWLYAKGSVLGEKLALKFSKQMKKSFPGFRSRGAKSRDQGDNGYGFLSRNRFPKIICEPFFGSNHNEWNCWKNAHEDLACLYIDALVDAGYVEKV